MIIWNILRYQLCANRYQQVTLTLINIVVWYTVRKQLQIKTRHNKKQRPRKSFIKIIQKPYMPDSLSKKSIKRHPTGSCVKHFSYCNAHFAPFHWFLKVTIIPNTDNQHHLSFCVHWLTLLLQLCFLGTILREKRQN